MRNTMSKTIVAALAALSLGASALATAEPAEAMAGRAWHGGGWHGGGWHGGGWHGGGWNGGYWGPAIVGGLAAGALLAAPYAYGYGYGPYSYGYNGCYSYQPMYDAYGNYVGQQAVRTCEARRFGRRSPTAAQAPPIPGRPRQLEARNETPLRGSFSTRFGG